MLQQLHQLGAHAVPGSLPDVAVDGLGQPDAYPFVLSAPAVDKLRFVHRLMKQS